MSEKRQLPVKCPSCAKPLEVKRLRCENCETEVDGSYPLPAILHLPKDDQEFILEFVKNSGSLKKMAQHMNRSYPLVRNRLDEVIENLKKLEQ